LSTVSTDQELPEKIPEALRQVAAGKLYGELHPKDQELREKIPEAAGRWLVFAGVPACPFRKKFRNGAKLLAVPGASRPRW
jgi:hypothetical protein